MRHESKTIYLNLYGKVRIRVSVTSIFLNINSQLVVLVNKLAFATNILYLQSLALVLY